MSKKIKKANVEDVLLNAPLGTVFETEGPLQGLTDEPLKWTVTKVGVSNGTCEVKATYMGIFFAQLRVNSKGVEQV